MTVFSDACALLDHIERALPCGLPESDDELEARVEELTRAVARRAEMVTQLASLELAALPIEQRSTVRSRVFSALERDAELARALDARMAEIADRAKDSGSARAAVRGYAQAALGDPRPRPGQRA